jgi:16S rRNA (uracil1498-N3)-methyltransferase
MTRRRWIADEVSAGHAALIGAHANHLTRVLRATEGQEFDIVAGGTVHRGRIMKISEGRVDFELGEELPAVALANVTLCLAIFKFDRMEWAIEKCTELGVARIVPVIARRSDAHLVAAGVKRAERWRRIGLQASEQSRRTVPPVVTDPKKLQDILDLGKVRIVLSEYEKQVQLRDLVESDSESSEVVLAIGPEGGWTDDELEGFRKSQWSAASLGLTILRAETAAIAAVAIAMSAFNG